MIIAFIVEEHGRERKNARAGENRMSVTIDDPPRMNLLGLILGGIIERNLEDPAKRGRFDKLAASVVVRAGEMAVTLAFDRGALVISRGAGENPKAQVNGSLSALMGLSLGGGMVGPWLAGRLKTRGSLLLLLKLKPLLQV
jgi:hypothetical protein